MPFTLAFQGSPVPSIPNQPGVATTMQARQSDRHEHFGTEAAALRRAADLLPGPDWLDLRLYGPDGRTIAGQAALMIKLGMTTDDLAETEIAS